MSTRSIGPNAPMNKEIQCGAFLNPSRLSAHRQTKTIRVNTLPSHAFKSISPHRESTTREDADLFLSFLLQLNELVKPSKRGNNANDSTIYKSKITSLRKCRRSGPKRHMTFQRKISPVF